jgi:hypothetical protein
MSVPRSAAAWLLTAVTAATASALPTPAAPHSGNPYSCRSAHVGAYWYHGVESDACDGLLITDGRFGGEAITGFGPDERIDHRSGPVRSCTVQLNRVVNGLAIPVPGARVTNTGRDRDYFDGRFCDAMGSWTPPSGFYNVTAIYRTGDGRTIETVQGPVAYYPGPPTAPGTTCQKGTND